MNVACWVKTKRVCFYQAGTEEYPEFLRVEAEEEKPAPRQSLEQIKTIRRQRSRSAVLHQRGFQGWEIREETSGTNR